MLFFYSALIIAVTVTQFATCTARPTYGLNCEHLLDSSASLELHEQHITIMKAVPESSCFTRRKAIPEIYVPEDASDPKIRIKQNSPSMMLSGCPEFIAHLSFTMEALQSSYWII